MIYTIYWNVLINKYKTRKMSNEFFMHNYLNDIKKNKSY